MNDIYQSFRAMPLWVQIWMAAILVPANMLGIFFLDHTIGIWLAVLGIGGMLPNLYFMAKDKGFSNAMALPHLIPWTILVIYLGVQLFNQQVPAGPLYYVVWAVLIIDVISLVFDFRDAVDYFQGKHHVAGR